MKTKLPNPQASETKNMKQYIQNILFGLAMLLIFTSFAMSADPAKPITSDVKYHHFLPTPLPEGLHYSRGEKKPLQILMTHPKKRPLFS